MVEAVMLWNEPNNMSHWDFELDKVDVVAIHGFPLDWNHWQLHEWPSRLAKVRAR